LSAIKRVPARQRGRRLSIQTGAAAYDGVAAAARQQGVRRRAKTAQGGCHTLSGMRRMSAPHGQHFRDDTETQRAAQH
jgi:hypothetical protein